MGVSIKSMLNWFSKSKPKDKVRSYPSGGEFTASGSYTELIGGEQFATWYRDFVDVPIDRQTRYMRYNLMDRDLVSMILDMYAEDATQHNLERDRTFWVETENENIKSILDKLMIDTLEIDDNCFSVARNIAKYGEEFDSVFYTSTGIVGWRPITKMTYRVVNPKTGELKGYSFKNENDPGHSLPWDLIHFKLVGRDRSRTYGTSMLDSIMSINSRLNLMEDSATVYRILKLPDRDVHYVDCTGLTAAQQARRLKFIESTINKQKYVNETSVTKEFDPLGSAAGDLFIATVQGRNDKMERQASSSRIQEVYDLEYFRRIWCASCNVPPERVGFDFGSGVFESGKSLMDQDVLYSRKIKRLQRAELKGIVLLCKMQLCLKGIDPDRDENKFIAKGNPISYIDEKERQELYAMKLQVIKDFTDFADSLHLGGKDFTSYLLTTFGGFSKDMIDEMYSEEIEGSGMSSMSSSLPEEPILPEAPAEEIPTEETPEGAERLTRDDKRSIMEAYSKNPNVKRVVEDFVRATKSILISSSGMDSGKVKLEYNSKNIVDWIYDVDNMTQKVAKLKEIIADGKGTSKTQAILDRFESILHNYHSGAYSDIVKGQ